MGDLTTQNKPAGLSALTLSEQELVSVLENSLYPGARQESIKMVLSYCKAAGLDPMQKPVHIVPIWDGKLKAMRDVIMPGIGLYRSNAARTGYYAGVSDPEFGPDVTEKIGDIEITYPKWCKVTVKRILPNDMVVEFSAIEFWKENYAQKGGSDKSISPNAMWAKRPYGQLSKCAESQALRKAFPEFGAQPTADEMEGHELYHEKEINPSPAQSDVSMPKSKAKAETDHKSAVIDAETGEILNPPPPKPEPRPEMQSKPRETQKQQQAAEPQGSAGMIGVVSKHIRNKQEEFNTAGVDFNVLNDVMTHFGITAINEVCADNVNDIMKHVRGLSAQ